VHNVILSFCRYFRMDTTENFPLSLSLFVSFNKMNKRSLLDSYLYLKKILFFFFPLSFIIIRWLGTYSLQQAFYFPMLLNRRRLLPLAFFLSHQNHREKSSSEKYMKKKSSMIDILCKERT